MHAFEQDYAFLFTDFGFRVIHREEAREGQYVMMVLESDRARIKVELDQGTQVLYFGARDAPLSWVERIDGVTVWFVDNALLNFVEHRSGIAKRSDGPARLRSHVVELEAAFAAERPREWWRAFDAYQAKELARIRSK